MTEFAAKNGPVGLTANLHFRGVVFAFVDGLDQEERHHRFALEVRSQTEMYDFIGIRRADLEPLTGILFRHASGGVKSVQKRRYEDRTPAWIGIRMQKGRRGLAAGVSVQG
jgi:hypothetical protein